MRTLDIFYNNIIKEATIGRIDAYFYYNIIFNTFIKEINTYYEAKSNNDDLLIPTLVIKNKEEFDKLLTIYVDKALEFYDDSNFPPEVLNDNMYEEELKICKEKIILSLLFANASYEDFNNSLEFLRKRIEFFDNTICSKYDLGYSDILKCNLSVSIEKDIINNETPYMFVVKCICDEDEFILPKLKFGISNNKAYVYAIQNDNTEVNSLSKKVSRKLYKTGEGFSSDNDNSLLFGIGNLNDITSSFLVVANIFISYLDKLGIRDINISSILVERWNSKVIANNFRSIFTNNYEELYHKQLETQSNLTDKFLRTFLRLCHHYNNLEITSYPMEISSELSIRNNGNIKCNNSLLLETYNLMMSSSEVLSNRRDRR